MGGQLDLQRWLRRRLVIDLEGRVVNAEALADERLQLPAALMAIVAGRDHDVGRKRREARGHLPDVQVVHLHHAGVRGQRAADRLRIQAGRSRLHEHPPGREQQP